MKFNSRVLAIFLFLALQNHLYALSWTVDLSGSGDYTSIQAAINAALTGDEVTVLPGTYYENIDFIGKDVVVKSADGPSATIIDAQGVGSVVNFHNGETRNASIIGFTLRNGAGSTFASPSPSGGGVICVSASPTIEGNLIENNAANGFGSTTGGGIGTYYNGGDGPLIKNNVIRNNETWFGGGIGLIDSNATILNNLITDNIGVNGGGISGNNGGLWHVTNNTIDSNSALRGGAISVFSLAWKQTF